MTVYFLDASTAVKAYAEEEGSDRVEEVLNHAEEVYLGRVGIVEAAAALFGKTKTGELEPEQAASAVALLREDVGAVYQIVEVDPVTSDRAI